MRLSDAGGREIEPVRAFDPVLADDAAEPVDRVSHLRKRAVRPLFEQRIEIALVEQAALAKRADAPIDAARLIEIQRRPTDVVEQRAESGALEGREREIHQMIGEQVAEHEDRALRRAEPGRNGGVAGREVEAELAFVRCTIRAGILRMGQLAPRPRRRRQTVRPRECEAGGAVVQRRRDIDIEAQIGKAAKQQSAVRSPPRPPRPARNPLGIERAVQGADLAAAGPPEVDRIHLERAIAVRGEVDATSAPARRLVAPIAIRQVADRAAAEIEGEEIVRACCPERRSVGGKHDGSPVRAHRRIEILIAIRCQPLETPRAQRIARTPKPEAIEVGVPGNRQAAEHDALAVWDPGGRQNRDELRELIAAHDF